MRWLLVLCLVSADALAQQWYPANTFQDGHPGMYTPLIRAAKPWRVCALLPHARDKYWWGVAWGLQGEAARQGVRIGIYQAGGYGNLAEQRRQFDHCLAMRADAIILGAISADGLNDQIDRAAKQNVPVIDLVNGVSSARVAARSLVSFVDMGFAAGSYLRAAAGTAPKEVAYFPGPEGPAWVRDAEKGARRALTGTQLTMVDAGRGAPESNAQMSLLRALVARSTPDFVLGNAVAVEVAATYFGYHGIRSRLVAFYASEPVVALIRSGRVLAAASDAPVVQARISVDLAVRVLEHQPHPRKVGPAIVMLDAATLPTYDMSQLFPPPNTPFVQMPLPPR